MAVIDVIANKFVKLWKTTFLCHYLHWLFLGISILGSILKNLEVVPKTYFSDSRNFLNVYFVKVSWGWTLLLLCPFIFFSNSNTKNIFKRLISVVVATIIWYVCTEAFNYIENVTGSCMESVSSEIVHEEHTTKLSCRKAGLHWHGQDISGHSFILAYSALIIREEMAPIANLRARSIILDLIYISLNGIVFIWIWMFSCTSVYFHATLHKVVGTFCGILFWHLTYKVWYRKPFSPGLPEKEQSA